AIGVSKGPPSGSAIRSCWTYPRRPGRSLSVLSLSAAGPPGWTTWSSPPPERTSRSPDGRKADRGAIQPAGWPPAAIIIPCVDFDPSLLAEQARDRFTADRRVLVYSS